MCDCILPWHWTLVLIQTGNLCVKFTYISFTAVVTIPPQHLLLQHISLLAYNKNYSLNISKVWALAFLSQPHTKRWYMAEKVLDVQLFHLSHVHHCIECGELTFYCVRVCLAERRVFQPLIRVAVKRKRSLIISLQTSVSHVLDKWDLLCPLWLKSALPNYCSGLTNWTHSRKWQTQH